MRIYYHATLAFLLSGSLLSQSTIRVPSDFESIQLALDEASAGDTILVAPGIYTELINWPVGKNLNLISEAGSEETILDGGGQGPIVGIETLPDESLFQGFTLQNGFTSSINVSALRIENTKIDLIDLIIRDNISEGSSLGSGAYLTGYDGRIESCQFLNNENSSNLINSSTGLLVDPINDIEITSCTFSDNQSMGTTIKSGGGLYILGSHSNAFPLVVFIKDCSFINNTAEGDVTTGGGGAIYALSRPSSLSLRLESCNFCNNRAISGASICLEGDVESTITNSHFSENKANVGDVLYMNGLFVLSGGVTRSNFISNSKIYGNGDNSMTNSTLFDGIEPGSLNMFNCEVRNNSSRPLGTFFQFIMSTYNVQNCTFAFNEGPIDLDETRLIISESIFWDKDPIEIKLESTSLLEISNSIINGAYSGVNVINTNPRFVSDEDLTLTPDSPAINAGTPSISITTDLLGNPRPLPAGTNPDLGCYEFNQEITSNTSDSNILEEINIFPNPTSDKINFSEMIDEIQIYNSAGREVKSVVQTSSVSTKDLPAGMYTIRLTLKGQSTTESISIIK